MTVPGVARESGGWSRRRRSCQSSVFSCQLKAQSDRHRDCDHRSPSLKRCTCLVCKTAGQALFAVFFAPPSPRLTEPTTPDCTANRIRAKRARPQHPKHVRRDGAPAVDSCAGEEKTRRGGDGLLDRLVSGLGVAGLLTEHPLRPQLCVLWRTERSCHLLKARLPPMKPTGACQAGPRGGKAA